MKQKFAIAFYFNEKITQFVKEGDNITAAIKSILRSEYNDISLSSSDLEWGIINALEGAGCPVDYKVIEPSLSHDEIKEEVRREYLESHKQELDRKDSYCKRVEDQRLKEIDQLLELFKGVTYEVKTLLESYDLLPPELLKKRLEYISKLKPW